MESFIALNRVAWRRENVGVSWDVRRISSP
jgi:hypothetical protein